MLPKSPCRILAALLHAICVLGLASCATRPSMPAPSSSRQPASSGTHGPALDKSSYTSFDGDRFPYKKWLPNGDTKLVIIGFHGIAGASDDLAKLGEHLRKHLPGTAVYAPDTRGQGNDPQVSRRGDIPHAEEWYKDAYTFNRLVRARHPGARVVWFGESMGSLIALHAAARAGGTDAPLFDALIVSSPITAIRRNIPRWRVHLLDFGAALFPKYRVSLEDLSGQENVRVTSEAVHQDQAQTNPWHVPEFTLRLLKTLGRLIRSMPAQAPAISEPVLILHGGKDVFSDPVDVEAFAARFPPAARVERRYYPDSHHLLFYDHERGRVLADVTRWLGALDR
jgi:acylglycerol lipase